MSEPRGTRAPAQAASRRPAPSAAAAEAVPDPWRLHQLRLGPAEALFAAISAAVPGLSRTQARQAVMAGLVTVDGTTQTEPKTALSAPSAVVVDLRHGIDRAFHARLHGRDVRNEAPFRVLHEDSDLIVVDKSAGILSAPAVETGERGHLPELLRRRWKAQEGDSYIGVVHRLDRDTSGCICFARTRLAQRMLGSQFAGVAAGRIYRCLVAGSPTTDEGVITGKLGHGRDGRRTVVEDDEPGKTAETTWKVIRRLGPVSELEVVLGTGRTHQIRVHMSENGMPVLGDRIYARPARGLTTVAVPRAPRLMLHAARLELDHPRTGTRLIVEAPLPAVWLEYVELITRPASAARPARRPSPP